MEDRQHFEIRRLDNGITIYSHKMDVPFFSLSVVLPVGSMHCIPENPGGIPGIAHFLEHIVLNRSKLHPGKDQFVRELSLKGGYINAATTPYFTRIYGQAPLAIESDMVAGFISHIWEPTLDNEEDLRIERTIVANERNQRKYFPYGNEVGQYLGTKWMCDVPVSKAQVFGTDADLEAMTPDKLQAFQDAYRADSTYVIVGGGHDLDALARAFSEVQTRPVSLQKHLAPITWTQREFHSQSFRDIDSPVYYLGGIAPKGNLETTYGLGFILRLLTNSVHGPLYEWLRKEKGWTYGVQYAYWEEKDEMAWWIELPLNEPGPVEEIRKEIRNRMWSALADGELIRKEAERRLLNDVYEYQTLGDRLGQARSSLWEYGRIIREQEYKDLCMKMNDPALLTGLYTEYCTPNMIGEFLALPE